MSNFQKYAEYYDLLYKDKDYQQESDFVVQLLREHAAQAQNLLELGCGTGRHAEHLIQAGYQVCGIERSPEMLSIARQRQQQLSPDAQAAFSIREGDLRTVRLEQKFDAVLALFHVISYQTLNEDLEAAFTTVQKHLKPDGIFLFDVWYGPAVLSNLPQVRLKRFENSNLHITRIAEPVHYPNENRVDVKYDIFVKLIDQNIYDEIKEVHRMRYLFKPEIDAFLNRSSMKLKQYGEWMSDREIGLDTWGVYFVAIKQ